MHVPSHTGRYRLKMSLICTSNYTNSLVNEDSFYANFTNMTFQKGFILQCTILCLQSPKKPVKVLLFSIQHACTLSKWNKKESNFDYRCLNFGFPWLFSLMAWLCLYIFFGCIVSSDYPWGHFASRIVHIIWMEHLKST